MRKVIAVFVSAATLMTAFTASAEPFRPMPDLQRVYPSESYTQYRHRRHYRPRHHYRHYSRRHHYYYRRDDGSALAAGVMGLAAGALIAGAIASQAQAQPTPPPPPGTVDPTVAAYCARKYRSYDPVTGTFLATNGVRYVCTYP